MTQTEASRALYPGWDYVAVFATWLWPKNCCHGVWERVGGQIQRKLMSPYGRRGQETEAPLDTVCCYLFLPCGLDVRLKVSGLFI